MAAVAHHGLPPGSPNDMSLDHQICPGCKRSAVQDDGGLVVAFGQSFFHVDCFKCAKCQDKVTADTNLLLLSDGSPICANCSYCCNVCQQPILDEAIMTGDDSYHAHCFRCKVCKSKIDELVFAKTSQGIYCMNCHNERMIKVRKHAQKKAERERARARTGASPGEQTPDGRSASRPQMHRSTSNNAEVSGASRGSPRSEEPSLTPQYATYPDSTPSKSRMQNTSSPASSSFRPHVTVAPPQDYSRSPVFRPPEGGNSRQNSLPMDSQGRNSDERRRPENGVQHLNLNGKTKRVENVSYSEPNSAALDTGTSRRDKRHSINPALSLGSNGTPTSPPAVSSSSLSPHSASFGSRIHGNVSATPPNGSRPSSPSSSSGHNSSMSYYHSATNSNNSFQPESNQVDPASRSRSFSTPGQKDTQPGADDTVIIRPPLRTSSTSDAVPRQRSAQRQSKTLSPIDGSFAEAQDRAQSRRSSHSLKVKRSRSGSRSPSPSHPTDVPHSIESGTDTEDEHGRSKSIDQLPPPLPPKESSPVPVHPRYVNGFPDPDVSVDPDTTVMSPDSLEDDSDSSPVERVSHSTFIAPALPPIRFSLNNNDFSDIFKGSGVPAGGNTGGSKALKTLEHLARISESQSNDPSLPLASPPPTATSDTTIQGGLTPSSDDHTLKKSESSVTLNYPLTDTEEGNTSFEDGANKYSTSESSHGHERSTPIQKLSRKLSKGRKSRKEKESPSPETRDLNGTKITISAPTDPVPISKSRQEPSDLVVMRLKQALTDANERSAPHLKLDKGFVEALVDALEARKSDYADLKSKFDGIRRTSKQYIDGLTVAQAEYDRELKARRDAEAEVTRLRVLLSGQAVRLTTLAGDSRRQEMRQQMTKELSDNLSGLEHDLSKLKAEREIALAEVEELSANKSPEAAAEPDKRIGRSLTMRLDGLKVQYERDLVPLISQREALAREIQELKGVREVFLEETTVLNARNEELAQLSAQYARRMEMGDQPSRMNLGRPSTEKLRSPPVQQIQQSPLLPASQMQGVPMQDDTLDFSKQGKVQRLEEATPSKGGAKFWPTRGIRTKEVTPSPSANVLDIGKSGPKIMNEHNFQQLSVLRFTRCDHCSDKMWGSQLRCSACNISVHVRCVNNVSTSCNPGGSQDEPQGPLPPSMFGRELTEQVRADAKGGDRRIPVIVEKCIEAVEALAMDYEGLYRKTGGSSQSKAITQLFERGDYSSFDLRDSDRFNDICSVTSVLKSYFRSLPDPLLTYELHDRFMTAVEIKDPAIKNKALLDLVNKLPDYHYFTLRMLMLHLNRVQERNEKNLMTARNLGVVFGPTLMRSRDPAAEFSDMAGKALSVEWLVENASLIFAPSAAHH